MKRPSPISWILNGWLSSQRLQFITGSLLVLILVGVLNATLLPRANIVRLVPVIVDVLILCLFKLRPKGCVAVLRAVSLFRVVVGVCLFAGPAVAIVFGAKTERLFSSFLFIYQGFSIWLSCYLLMSLNRKDVRSYLTRQAG